MLSVMTNHTILMLFPDRFKANTRLKTNELKLQKNFDYFPKQTINSL